MKLDRLAYDPAALAGFYEEGFGALGALCERTWHDRLEIVAEGAAAKPWNPDGTLHEEELTFVPADVTTARDGVREVFPGCPLTFQLADALRPTPLVLERVALADGAHLLAPEPAVAEKLWRAQFPNTKRWQLTAPFKADSHYSLVALVRCEIQAIDQHWSVRRLALSLPDGESDDLLAEQIGFAQPDPALAGDAAWPASDPAGWEAALRTALEADLGPELADIRKRQEQYLRRELDRIDDYFANYGQELAARAAHSASSNVKLKTGERLAAAKVEHARRRADQVARHEIRVQPHFDALLLVAERAWRGGLQVELGHQPEALEARFVPRARRWFRS
jgi:hypothetical protein